MLEIVCKFKGYSLILPTLGRKSPLLGTCSTFAYGSFTRSGHLGFWRIGFCIVVVREFMIFEECSRFVNLNAKFDKDVEYSFPVDKWLFIYLNYKWLPYRALSDKLNHAGFVSFRWLYTWSFSGCDPELLVYPAAGKFGISTLQLTYRAGVDCTVFSSQSRSQSIEAIDVVNQSGTSRRFQQALPR